MNENIDLTKILKNCPKGTKFYSTIYGEVEFDSINKFSIYPIILRTDNNFAPSVTKYGIHVAEYEGKGECTLFPSKDQRDWSKFTAPWYKSRKFDHMTLQPFDKVLVRDYSNHSWKVDFYSHKNVNTEYQYRCVGNAYRFCIPYNGDTKYLVGTTDEAPEYYRYWED